MVTGARGAGAASGRTAGGAGSRHVPWLRLLAYYVAIVGAAVALIQFVPDVRRFFFAPIPSMSGAEAGDVFAGTAQTAIRDETIFERTITTALVTLGALALAVPVAWVYMITRRYRFDRALVQSVIILPLVVSGIVVVVKDSIALAFSLAGIVAAVRFRNTLDDPRDAVYIFLALGIGLAAGVQALDVGLVSSLAFNLAVLVMWRFNAGAVYPGAGDEEGLVGMGDASLFAASSADARRRLRNRYAELTEELKTDGLLLVHAADAGAARRVVDLVLPEVAKDWKYGDPEPAEQDGITTLPVAVKLKKKGTPVELLGQLDERGAAVIAAAEYVPDKTDREI